MAVRQVGSGYIADGDSVLVTDGRPGAALYVGTTQPAAPQTGDIWIDNAAGLSALSTKGDLASFDGSSSATVSVGANGTVLTADSSQTSGLAWAYRADEISSIMGGH
jgi:hypothetical protein